MHRLLFAPMELFAAVDDASKKRAQADFSLILLRMAVFRTPAQAVQKITFPFISRALEEQIRENKPEWFSQSKFP